MKQTRFVVFALAAMVSFSAVAPGQSSSTASDLVDRTVARRAVGAVNWRIPAVNYDRMIQAMVGDAKGKLNQMPFIGRPS